MQIGNINNLYIYKKTEKYLTDIFQLKVENILATRKHLLFLLKIYFGIDVYLNLFSPKKDILEFHPNKIILIPEELRNDYLKLDDFSQDYTNDVLIKSDLLDMNLMQSYLTEFANACFETQTNYFKFKLSKNLTWKNI